MPFPASNTNWPPEPHGVVLDACSERQVWWEGDPRALAEFYSGKRGAGRRPQSVRARVFRFLTGGYWSKGHDLTQDSERLHVPIAADIGRVAASTLFSEPPAFRDPNGDETVQKRIDELLNTPEMHSRLLTSAESASMLSGVFGRIVWDEKLAAKPWIDFVDADRAVPTFKWGQLVDVMLFTELAGSDDREVWRHFELYHPGRVENRLYVGTPSNVGEERSLDAHPATKGLAPSVRTGTDKLTAAYFPNHRPNPGWRNIPELAPLGRSDLTSPVLHLLDKMDECWSSWMRDLELGKGRIVVSESLLSYGKPGDGARFDTDTKVFSPVKNAIKDGEEATLIEAHQFEIRVEEHRQTFEALLRRAISYCGFSPITFGLQDEAAVTATEVDAKERDTNATRASRLRLWTSPLAQLATVLLEVDAAKFPGEGGKAPDELLEVDVPPAHQQSAQQIAETVDMLNRANAASIETKVRMIHPEWDDEQVGDEVALIQEETRGSVPAFPDEGNQGDPFATDQGDDPAEEPVDDPNADPDAPADGTDGE